MLDPIPSPEEIFQRKDEFGLETSIEMLNKILDNEKESSKRRGAIKYIGLVSKDAPNLKKSCFETLENILVSEDGIEIKCEAAKSIGKLKYEKALKPLLWILNQETLNPDLELSVLKAIRKTKFEEAEINIFINQLGSQYSSTRDFVRNKLFSLEPEMLINLLLKSLAGEDISNEHKIEIVKVIGSEISSINVSFEDMSYFNRKYPEIVTSIKNGKILLLNHITRVLKEEDHELMTSILSILKIFGPDINQDIVKLLLSDDFIIKKNAITLAGKLRLSDAVEQLINDLDNIYNEVSLACIEALGEIGDLSAVPELLDILNIEDISFEYTDLDMKLYILDAIKKIYLGNTNAPYDFLYEQLKTGNNTLQESIAFLLGEIGKQEAVKPLTDLLNVRNLDVRKNTMIALGKIGHPEALDHLIRFIENVDTYWLIKKVAIDAIYNIFQKNWYRVKEKDEELRRTLNKDTAILIDYLKGSENENFKVKLSLIKFLEVYGGENALEALITRVNDFHRVVRIHASNAIKKIEEQLELEQN